MPTTGVYGRNLYSTYERMLCEELHSREYIDLRVFMMPEAFTSSHCIYCDKSWFVLFSFFLLVLKRSKTVHSTFTSSQRFPSGIPRDWTTSPSPDDLSRLHQDSPPRCTRFPTIRSGRVPHDSHGDLQLFARSRDRYLRKSNRTSTLRRRTPKMSKNGTRIDDGFLGSRLSSQAEQRFRSSRRSSNRRRREAR